jgi:hypothetical protein
MSRALVLKCNGCQHRTKWFRLILKNRRMCYKKLGWSKGSSTHINQMWYEEEVEEEEEQRAKKK